MLPHNRSSIKHLGRGLWRKLSVMSGTMKQCWTGSHFTKQISLPLVFTISVMYEDEPHVWKFRMDSLSSFYVMCNDGYETFLPMIISANITGSSINCGKDSLGVHPLLNLPNEIWIVNQEENYFLLCILATVAWHLVMQSCIPEGDSGSLKAKY